VGTAGSDGISIATQPGPVSETRSGAKENALRALRIRGAQLLKGERQAIAPDDRKEVSRLKSPKLILVIKFRAVKVVLIIW
jgi:hypothetical protein